MDHEENKENLDAAQPLDGRTESPEGSWAYAEALKYIDELCASLLEFRRAVVECNAMNQDERLWVLNTDRQQIADWAPLVDSIEICSVGLEKRTREELATKVKLFDRWVKSSLVEKFREQGFPEATKTLNDLDDWIASWQRLSKQLRNMQDALPTQLDRSSLPESPAHPETSTENHDAIERPGNQRGGKRNQKWLIYALVEMANDPDLNQSEIAKRVGKAESTLSRNEIFKDIYKRISQGDSFLDAVRQHADSLEDIAKKNGMPLENRMW